MKEPVRHAPLACIDPLSIEPDDIVDVDALCSDGAYGVVKFMMLKRNKNQKFYYFPYMENDDVLVFR